MPPEAPQVMPGLLFVGRRAGRDHLIVAGIERAGDAPDRAALARRIPALEDEDRRNALLVGFPLQQIQPSLLTLERGAEAFGIEPLRHFELLEDVVVAFDLIEDRAGPARGTRGFPPRVWPA